MATDRQALSDRSALADSAVIAIVQRQGAEWYANEVVAPMLNYDFQGEVNVCERVQRHMAGFPEPLRSECRRAVAALETGEETR